MKKIILITFILIMSVIVYAAYLEKPFYVANTGGGSLVGTARLMYANSPFGIVSNMVYNLTNNQTQTVTIRFDIGKTGRYTNYVIFSGGGGSTNIVIGTVVPLPPINLKFK